MAGRLPTGITVLDRRLGGGIPAGSLVLLSASPASQSELFLHELTAARGTLYLTTIRSAEAVQDAFDRSSARVGKPTIRDVGSDAPLDHANRLVGALPDDSNLIVDAVDVLEREEPARYRNFLNALQTHMVNTGGVAVLHALSGGAVPENRDVTAHVADVVFDLRTRVKGSEIENRLAVPKFRGGAALDETIKLTLAERVTIDTSRDIA
ncbi:RAD55 family ATPase [Halegenticoccus tardaugens]|uniref:RAD55 family ATPase n=1 Tax=Halegenticoccus tardaugens TaxID=2071624 RepID=UPI00100BF94E|nr:transcriptional regulator [Halegenticoccus tardaugens]